MNLDPVLTHEQRAGIRKAIAEIEEDRKARMERMLRRAQMQFFPQRPIDEGMTTWEQKDFSHAGRVMELEMEDARRELVYQARCMWLERASLLKLDPATTRTPVDGWIDVGCGPAGWSLRNRVTLVDSKGETVAVYRIRRKDKALKLVRAAQ